MIFTYFSLLFISSLIARHILFMHLNFTLDENVNFVSYAFYVTFIFVSVDFSTNKVYMYRSHMIEPSNLDE